MVIVHKSNTSVGYDTLYVYGYVELDENNPTEYVGGIGASIDTEAVINKAFKNSTCLENITTYGMLGRLLRESLDLESDDSYDGTIADMLKRRDNSVYDDWNNRFATLEEVEQSTEYNDKTYKTYLHVFITKRCNNSWST